MFTIGVFAIIFDEQGRVLLSHRRDMDLWNLPGGGMESGELPTDTAVRETREETGLEVVVERFVGVYGKPNKDELVFTFVCRVTGGQLDGSEEADAQQFFAPDALPPNTIPKHAERVRDALQPDAPPIFRVQTGPSSRQWLKSLGAQTNS